MTFRRGEGIIQPITQTVEEEEYPSGGDGKGSREQWDRGTDPDGEWTSEGHGETHASSHGRDPAPVIQAARMLVRERKPASVGKLSGTAEYPPQADEFHLPGAFFHGQTPVDHSQGFPTNRPQAKKER